MSRAFSPPETLSKDDIHTLGDVRREIWTQAWTGMGVGGVTGLSAHYLTSLAQPRVKVLRGLSLNRNTAMASTFIGATLGSYLMATATGKNQVHRLHPIFEVGKLPDDQRGGRPHPMEEYYQRSIQRAKERGEQINSEMIDNPKERMWNRAIRRKTLQRRITEEATEALMMDDEEDESSSTAHLSKDDDPTKFTK